MADPTRPDSIRELKITSTTLQLNGFNQVGPTGSTCFHDTAINAHSMVRGVSYDILRFLFSHPWSQGFAFLGCHNHPKSASDVKGHTTTTYMVFTLDEFNRCRTWVHPAHCVSLPLSSTTRSFRVLDSSSDWCDTSPLARKAIPDSDIIMWHLKVLSMFSRSCAQGFVFMESYVKGYGWLHIWPSPLTSPTDVGLECIISTASHFPLHPLQSLSGF